MNVQTAPYAGDYMEIMDLCGYDMERAMELVQEIMEESGVGGCGCHLIQIPRACKRETAPSEAFAPSQV